MELASVDAAYIGPDPVEAAAAHSIALDVVKLPEPKRGLAGGNNGARMARSRSLSSEGKEMKALSGIAGLLARRLTDPFYLAHFRGHDENCLRSWSLCAHPLEGEGPGNPCAGWRRLWLPSPARVGTREGSAYSSGE